MRKILMISYYYPPILDVGSLRALGFSQNLHRLGWKPYILSVKNPDKSVCKVSSDHAIENLKVFYCYSWFNLNRITWKVNGAARFLLKIFGCDIKTNIVHDLFCFPDVFVGWVLPCYLKGLKLIRKNNIDLIYVSCKPFSTAFAGVMLKKSTKKPLILDFRDPVSFPSYLFNDNFVGRYRRKVIKKLEKFVLERTNRLLTTTEETKNAYIEIYPFLKDKIQRIYNGYYLPKNDGYTARNHEKFIIGYMGNFYYDLIPSDNFFKALKKIISEKMIPANMIEFLYVGSLRKKKNWLDKVSKSYNLKNNIRSIGYIQRTETQKVLMQCALLLLRIAPPMISTKLFEGLRDGIPLLAVIEPGEVEKLIKEYSSNSYIITSNRIEDIVKAIMDAFDRWKNNDLKWSTNNDYLTKFCKQALTDEFIAGIDDIHQITQEEIYKKIKVINPQ